jgi:hypothetical protein
MINIQCTNVYLGEYENNLRSGFGSFMNVSVKYEGNWLNGFKHGEGFFRTGRYEIKGNWKEDRLFFASELIELATKNKY